MPAETAEQKIYNRLASAMTYHPSGANLFADDWTLEPGDVVTVKSGEDEYSVPVYSMNLQWNGASRVEIESTGNQKREPLSALRRKQYSAGRAAYIQQEENEEKFQEFSTWRTETDTELSSHAAQFVEILGDGTEQHPGRLPVAETAIIQTASNVAITAEATGLLLDENGNPVLDEHGHYQYDPNAANTTLNAKIGVEAGRITAEVSRATGAEGSLSSLISAEAGKISQIVTAVGDDGQVTAASIVTAINSQGQGAVTIKAASIDLDGLVTATKFQTALASIENLTGDLNIVGDLTVGGNTNVGSISVESYSQYKVDGESIGLGSGIKSITKDTSLPEGQFGFTYTTFSNDEPQSINFNIADTTYFKSRVGINTATIYGTSDDQSDWNDWVKDSYGSLSDPYALIRVTANDGSYYHFGVNASGVYESGADSVTVSSVTPQGWHYDDVNETYANTVTATASNDATGTGTVLIPTVTVKATVPQNPGTTATLQAFGPEYYGTAYAVSAQTYLYLFADSDYCYITNTNFSPTAENTVARIENPTPVMTPTLDFDSSWDYYDSENPPKYKLGVRIMDGEVIVPGTETYIDLPGTKVIVGTPTATWDSENHTYSLSASANDYLSADTQNEHSLANGSGSGTLNPANAIYYGKSTVTLGTPEWTGNDDPDNPSKYKVTTANRTNASGTAEQDVAFYTVSATNVALTKGSITKDNDYKGSYSIRRSSGGVISIGNVTTGVHANTTALTLTLELGTPVCSLGATGTANWNDSSHVYEYTVSSSLGVDNTGNVLTRQTGTLTLTPTQAINYGKTLVTVDTAVLANVTYSASARSAIASITVTLDNDYSTTISGVDVSRIYQAGLDGSGEITSAPFTFGLYDKGGTFVRNRQKSINVSEVYQQGVHDAGTDYGYAYIYSTSNERRCAFRSSPSSSGDPAHYMSANTYVHLEEDPAHPATSGWVKISYENETGYVSSSLVHTSAKSGPNVRTSGWWDEHIIGVFSANFTRTANVGVQTQTGGRFWVMPLYSTRAAVLADPDYAPYASYGNVKVYSSSSVAIGRTCSVVLSDSTILSNYTILDENA